MFYDLDVLNWAAAIGVFIWAMIIGLLVMSLFDVRLPSVPRSKPRIWVRMVRRIRGTHSSQA